MCSSSTLSVSVYRSRHNNYVFKHLSSTHGIPDIIELTAACTYLVDNRSILHLQSCPSETYCTAYTEGVFLFCCYVYPYSQALLCEESPRVRGGGVSVTGWSSGRRAAACLLVSSLHGSPLSYTHYSQSLIKRDRGSTQSCELWQWVLLSISLSLETFSFRETCVSVKETCHLKKTKYTSCYRFTLNRSIMIQYEK